jgi:hypothetical protein
VRALILALLLVACSSPKTAEQTVNPQSGTPEPSDCVKECEQRNMMRAVSAEMIRQDCERECEASKN